MGISKLQRMIDDLCLCEEVKVEKTGLIIDGAALYYSLYYNSYPKLDQHCGGDYPGFKDDVCKFFEALQDCEVTPYVILDGASGSEKQKSLHSRLKRRLENAKTIAESEPDAVPKGCNVLPPLVKDVFIEILKEKGIEFKQCLGEADPEVVSAANQKQCAVLSHDADFCIYDVNKGFLHLEHFEWKRKKDGKIPAKLYTLSKFCEHFKLDPALMPVFASIAGNDYSILEDRGRFARQSSSSGEYSIKRLDGILRFLSKVNLDGLNDSQKRERALSQALSHVGKEENQTFKLSIQKYVQLEKPSSELPSWVRKKVERGELTTFVISVVDQKTMMLPALVEDFSQRSSYTAAYPIRQYFYGLLIGGQMCTEYDRDREEIKDKRVPSIGKQLQLEHLHKAPEGLRRRVFEEALQVQTLDLENIPDQLKLPVCVTVFWFNNLKLGQKPETVHCLHALLLGFVCDRDGPEDKFERKMKALKDEGVSNWQPRVAHAFSQWLCCMRQSLHLNQLLCSPLPESQCARLYCGPLLHRLADEETFEKLLKTLRGKKKKLYQDLKTIFHLLARKKTLVIGDSVLKDVDPEIPATTLTYRSGATAGDIEAKLKLLAQDEHRFDKIVIHVSNNDIQNHQLEVIKPKIESVCNFAKTMSHSVGFSGPLPSRTSPHIIRSLSSFNCWLSNWCPENYVGFINNWKMFGLKPGLIESNHIYPTREGADLISRNLAKFILS
ncbi:protein asteroid homolog 1-like [Simochromis diagramma]|uniref:protein asteroid homolog 1-like n=1 Tax=Simochromis diagramma TaxID=43689 RepID=UPI001A7E44DC|nr:protein asteroid homolog 1-like [Simochromis diagramma]